MFNWWLHGLYQTAGLVAVASWIFWVLFSITLHELSHGYAAIRQGDRTPIELGRMTWNPIVHMGTTSLLLFALAGIAWGLMPVNPQRFRNRKWGDLIVTAAGPAMNFALAVLCVVLGAAWRRFGPVGEDGIGRNLALFFYFGAYLNLFLGVFNLFPIPPLDGARILASLSRPMRDLYAKPEAQMFGFFIFIAVFFMTPLGDVLMGGMSWAAVEAIRGLSGG